MSGIANKKLVCLDSNIFIYHFESHPEFSRYTKPIFGQLTHNKLEATTSTISLIEALSFPLPNKILAEIEEAFLNLPNLSIIDINKEVAKEAARIRRTHNFRLGDAIQLATAVCSKANTFITNDKRLKSFKELRVMLLSEFIRN